MKNKDNTIDENVVRVIAAQVVLLVLLALQNQWIAVFIFLSFDFALRAFTNYSSPLSFLAKSVVRLAKLEPKYIFSGSKKFAAGLGTLFSVITLILLIAQFNLLAWIVGLSLIACALLESTFKICVGCYLYDWFVAPIMNHRHKKIYK